jgi:hypothetical protein
MPSSQMLRRVASCSISSQRASVATANVIPSSPILVTLMMEAIRSSETSVLTRAALRNIPNDGILPKSTEFNIIIVIGRDSQEMT